jgi:hypothetical protein
MEGTSGAADLGSLRGDPGEAALGPGIGRVSSPMLSFWMNVARFAQAGSVVFIQTAGLAKADRAEATQAQSLVFIREVRLVRRVR